METRGIFITLIGLFLSRYPQPDQQTDQAEQHHIANAIANRWIQCIQRPNRRLHVLNAREAACVFFKHVHAVDNLAISICHHRHTFASLAEDAHAIFHGAEGCHARVNVFHFEPIIRWDEEQVHILFASLFDVRMVF